MSRWTTTLQSNKLDLTEDGSHSVFSEKFQALYHSKHGAIQESMHVFIEAGLRPLLNKDLSVLEMGFGTGLNALLTLRACLSSNVNVYYETVEAYPVDKSVYSKLNYISELGSPELGEQFKQMHSCEWEQTKQFGNFSLKKRNVKLEDAEFNSKFDLVYYDAFAPLTQEELWTPEIFMHVAQFLNPNAVLVSYCAKGSFKRALIAAGFQIEKIPGPPGKREMIRATLRSSES